MKIVDIKSIKRVDEKTLELRIIFDAYPGEELIFIARPDDCEEFGRHVYAQAVAGNLGEIH